MNFYKKIIATAVYLLIILIFSGIIALGVIKPHQWLIGLLFLIIIAFIINSIFCLYIFYSNRNDVRKKTWILFFAIAPLIAPFFFLWYGYNPIQKKDQKKLINNLNKNIENRQSTLKTDNDIINHLDLLLSNFSINKPANGSVRYIKKLENFYSEIIDLIRDAKQFIILNYFIINDGFFFRTIINELKIKKEQGVKVYFTYDWIWSNKKISRSNLKKLNDEFNFGIFKPKKQLLTTSKHNNRNHKKYIIVDGQKAIYGGSNIADEYLNQNIKYNYWKDTNFIIEGEVVKCLINSFIFDCELFIDSKKPFDLEYLKNFINKKDTLNLNEPYFLTWDSYPEYDISTCFNVYKVIIPHIKNELIISTPYLYPTNEIMSLLINAIKMGVKIKFLLPMLPDNKKIIVWLNRVLYRDCLLNNIEIYELSSFNHGKYWIIDDNITILTSVNFDPRAMNINYENSLLYYNQQFNQQMREEFNNSLAFAKKITLSDLQQKKWKYKILFFKFLSMLFEPAM